MNLGDVLGPYVIEARLGQGGMGEVYRAREGKAIPRLNHPHICSLHDVGRAPGSTTR